MKTTGRAVSLMLIALVVISLLKIPPGEPIHLRVGISSLTMRSIGIIICDQVWDAGRYNIRKNATFRPGETVYIYNEVEVRSPRARSFKFILEWTLEIYDPVGALVARSVQRLSPKVAYGSAAYAVWFKKPVSRVDLEGLYRVVLRIRELVSGESLKEEGTFFIIDAAPVMLRISLNQTLIFENEGPSAAILRKLYVPLIKSVRPYQEVLQEPIFSRYPETLENDQWGNRYAFYKDIRIPKGGEFRLKIIYFLRIHFKFFPDPNISLSEFKARVAGLKHCLEPTKYIESDAPEIRKVADQISAGYDNPYQISRAIANYTYNYIKYDKHVDEKLGALWTLINRRGKCIHFSRLFVALGRAIGIPSRVVLGLRLEPIVGTVVKTGEGAAHAWAEIYMPDQGWIPVEPQSGIFKFGRAPPEPVYICLLQCPSEAVIIDGKEFEAACYFYAYVGRIRSYFELSYKIEKELPERFPSKIEVQLAKKCYIGERVKVSGILHPPLSNKAITFYFYSPSGRLRVFRSITRNGAFTLTVMFNETGTWRVQVVWIGDSMHSPALTPPLEIEVIKRKSRIAVSYPSTAEFGDALVIRGQLDPPLEGEEIEIVLQNPLGREFIYSIKTGPGGTFEANLGPLLLPGAWKLSISWAGNYMYEPSGLALTIIVGVERIILIAILLTIAIVSLFFYIRRKRKKG